MPLIPPRGIPVDRSLLPRGGFRFRSPCFVRTSHRLRRHGSLIFYEPVLRVPLDRAGVARKQLAARSPCLRRALAGARREARRLDRQLLASRRRAWLAWIEEAMADIATSSSHGNAQTPARRVPPPPSGAPAETRRPAFLSRLCPGGAKGIVLAGALGVGALLPASAQTAQAAAPTEAQTPQFDGALSGVAAVQGLEGADWHTDGYLYDAGAAPITVRLSWAPKGVAPDPDSYIPLTLQPHETVTLEDVVATTFATQGSGQIAWSVIDGDPSTLVVNANTYNRLSASEQYGQEVVGRRWVNVPNQTVPLVAPAPVDFTSYRANLAFTAGPGTTQVRIVARNKSGNQLYNEVLTVAPGSWNQIVRAVEQLAPGQLPGVWFQVIGLDGQVDAAMSFVNNATGDAADIMARALSELEPNVYFTGAAFLDGANGAHWQSNHQVINPHDQQQALTLAYLPRGVDNSGELSFQPLSLLSLTSRVFENVVGDFLALPNGSAGALYMNALPETPPMAFLQTLNKVGVDEQGRTVAYGQNVPGVNESQSAAGDLEQIVTGIVHNDDFRANLLLQNTRYDDLAGSYVESDATVTLWNPDGTVAATKTYHLLPGEYLQHDKFIDDILGADVEGGTLTVATTPLGQYERGGVNAAVTVVNGNRNPGIGTNDGRYIQGVPVTIINQAPVFEGNDVFCDGIDDGLVDVNPKDGVIDRGILAYISDNYSGCILASDADGDPLTYTWTDIDRGSLPPGFSYQGKDWTWNLGAPGINPGLYNLQVTVTDNRGGEFTEVQRWDIRTPPQ